MKRGPRRWTARAITYSYDMLGEAARTDADASAIAPPMPRRSPSIGDAAARRERRATIPASRSSSRRCIRATSGASASASWTSWCRRARRSRCARAAPTSASTSTPRRPTGSTSRSTSSRRVLADPRLAGWDGFGVVVQAYGRRARPRHRLARRAGRAARPRASWCGWSRAPTGTPRSSGRRCWGLPASRCSPARPTTDVSYLANARKLLGMTRPHLSAVRHPQRPHRRRGARTWRGTGQAASSSSACTAWARRCTRSCASATGTALPHLCAGRRALATCSPIWCAACSRTAPTPPSSTRSSTRTCRAEAIAADPFAAVAAPARRRQSAHPAAGRHLRARPRELARAGTSPTRLALARSMPSARGFAAPQLAAGADRRGGGRRAERGRSSTRPIRPTWSARSSRRRPRTVDGRHRRRRRAPARAGRGRSAERARDPAPGRRPLRGATPPSSDRAARARGRQDARRRRRRGARGGRFPALLRGEARAEAGRPAGARRRSPASRPWNFPLAIFTGQVAAALAAGNTVLAKPAEQTPLIAARAVRAAARGRRAARRAAAAARATGRRSARR